MARPRRDEQVDEVMVDRMVREGKYEGANHGERVAAVEKMRATKPEVPVWRMAEQVGVTTRTVQRMARQKGWTGRRIRHDADEMHRLIAEAIGRCPKITIAELASSLGVHHNTVIKYTKSAVEVGVLAPDKARRNRVGPPRSVSTCREPDRYQAGR